MFCLVSLSVILHIKNCSDCVFMVLFKLNLFLYINTFSTSNALGFKVSFAPATPEPHTQSRFGLFPEFYFANDQQ